MTHTWSLCERPSLPSLLSRPKTVEEFVKSEENIDIRKVKISMLCTNKFRLELTICSLTKWDFEPSFQ